MGNKKFDKLKRQEELDIEDICHFGICDDCKLFSINAKEWAIKKQIKVFCSLILCRKDYNLNVAALGPIHLAKYVNLNNLFFADEALFNQTNCDPTKCFNQDSVGFGYCSTCAEYWVTKIKLEMSIDPNLENLSLEEKWTRQSQSKLNIFLFIDFCGTIYKRKFFAELESLKILDHYKSLQNGVHKIQNLIEQ